MNVELISVPFDSGVADVRMGRGPERILQAGLVQHLKALGHDVGTQRIAAPPMDVPSEVAVAFGLNQALAATVAEVRRRAAFPVVLSGSCYSALGTVSGLTVDSGSPPSVVWLDSHADFNTPETTTSGFLDGMAISMLTGSCFRRLAETVPGYMPVPDEQLVLVGTRDIDPPEAERLRTQGIPVLAPSRVRDDLAGALEALEGPGGSAPAVYLHVDLDVLDPLAARANALAAPDGLDVEDLLAVVHAVRDRGRLLALALTAYDPAVDPEGRVVDAAFAVLGEALG